MPNLIQCSRDLFTKEDEKSGLKALLLSHRDAKIQELRNQFRDMSDHDIHIAAVTELHHANLGDLNEIVRQVSEQAPGFKPAERPLKASEPPSATVTPETPKDASNVAMGGKETASGEPTRTAPIEREQQITSGVNPEVIHSVLGKLRKAAKGFDNVEVLSREDAVKLWPEAGDKQGFYLNGKNHVIPENVDITTKDVRNATKNKTSAEEEAAKRVLVHENAHHVIAAIKDTPEYREEVAKVAPEVLDDLVERGHIGVSESEEAKREEFAAKFVEDKMFRDALKEHHEGVFHKIIEAIKSVWQKLTGHEPESVDELVKLLEEAHAKGVEASPSTEAKGSSRNDALRDAWDRYDDTGEITFGDLVEEVDFIASESGNRDLSDAVERYRQEKRDDYALAGRGDMEAAEADFESAIKSVMNASLGAKGASRETFDKFQSEKERGDKLVRGLEKTWKPVETIFDKDQKPEKRKTALTKLVNRTGMEFPENLTANEALDLPLNKTEQELKDAQPKAASSDKEKFDPVIEQNFRTEKQRQSVYDTMSELHKNAPDLVEPVRQILGQDFYSPRGIEKLKDLTRAADAYISGRDTLSSGRYGPNRDAPARDHESVMRTLAALDGLHTKEGGARGPGADGYRRYSASKIHDWFIQHHVPTDEQNRALIKGDALPAIVQLRSMEFLQSMASEIYDPHSAYNKERVKALGPEAAERERLQTQQRIRDHATFANDAILSKYTSASGAGRILGARGWASNGGNGFFETIKNVRRGLNEFRDKVAREAGEDGEAAAMEGSVDGVMSKTAKDFDPGSSGPVERLMRVFKGRDEIKAASEREQAAVDAAWIAIKDKQSKSYKALKSEWEDASGELLRLQAEVDKRTKKQSAKAASSEDPSRTPLEELNRQIKAVKQHLQELMKEAITQGHAPEERTTWFSKQVKDLIEADPELSKLIKEFEDKAPRPESQQKQIEQAFKDQIKSKRTDEIFMADMKERFGMSDAEAVSFMESAKEAERKIDDERTALKKRMIKADPTTLLGSQAFMKRMAAEILSSPALQASNPEWRKSKVMDELATYGIPKEDTRAIAEQFDEMLATQWRNAAVEAADRVFKRIAKKNPKIDDLSLAARIIASLDSMAAKAVNGEGPRDLVGQALAQAGGFKDVADVQWAQLAKLGSEREKYSKTSQGRAVVSGKMLEVMQGTRLPKDTLEVITQGYINNTLSGLGTLGKNFFQYYNAATRVATNMARHAVEGRSDPKMAVAMIKEELDNAMRAFGVEGHAKALKRGKLALETDTYSQHQAEHLAKLHSMRESFHDSISLFNKALEEKRHTAMLGHAMSVAWKASDITRRIMATADEMWGHGVQDLVLGSEAMRALVKQGKLTPAEASLALKTARDRAPLEAQKHFGESYDKASELEKSAMVDDMRDQLIIAEVDNHLSEKGITGVGKQIRETMIQESPFELGNRESEEMPAWDIGNVPEAIKKMAQGFRSHGPAGELIGRVLLGYVTVPANLLNRSLYYSPLGIARALYKLKGNPVKSKAFYQETMATEMQAKQRLAEGIAGTVGMTVLAGLLSQKDDEGNGITVTGMGPTNPAEREAWLKRGHHPQSIEMRMGKTIYSIPWGNGGAESLQGPMMALGAASDIHLNGGAKTKGEAVGAYVHSALQNIKGASSFLAGGQTLQNIFDNSEKKMWSTFAYSASGMVPFAGLAKSVQRIAQGPSDQSSIAAAVGSQIPYTNFFTGRPALNALGDPIRTTPTNLFSQLTEKGYNIGLPIYVGIDPQSKDAGLYRMFQTKGAAPSAPAFSRMNEDYGLNEESYHRFLKVRGGILKSILNSDTNLRMMSDDDFKKALTHASSKATSEAAGRLGLKKEE